MRRHSPHLRSRTKARFTWAENEEPSQPMKKAGKIYSNKIRPMRIVS
jgi:hypothetical protein